MKKIGLIDADTRKEVNIYHKTKTFPNLALMKISAYYKQKGYKVEWYSPVFHTNYHKIFVSKIFTYSSLWDSYLKKDMIIGGSGYNLTKKLPKKIEHYYPDYDLYKIDYAMGFIVRGCIRHCPYCIVPEKEGNIRNRFFGIKN